MKTVNSREVTNAILEAKKHPTSGRKAHATKTINIYRGQLENIGKNPNASIASCKANATKAFNKDN